MDTPDPMGSRPPVCYRHSSRETRLSCSECGRPICAECSHDSAVGQRCPECAKPKGRNRVIDARQTTGVAAGLNNAPVNKAILAITIAVFAVGLVNQEARDWLFQNLSSWNFALANGEWWRLVSSALVHSYSLIIHIGFNMYFLYMLGPALERQVGSAPFAALYVATAATGGVAGYYLGGIRDSSIGASGAIFGIVAVWMYAAYKSGHRGARMMANRQMLYLVGVGIVLPFFASGLNISWQGHLGGLLGGLAIGWAWGLAAPQSNNPKLTRTVLATAVLVASIVVVTVIPAGWG
ncbi:MAG: rhomboid family intramembrane serine protease [bacterium]|nr:rhomboid family intramembrane serine protease [bacterium]